MLKQIALEVVIPKEVALAEATIEDMTSEGVLLKEVR